MLTPPVAAQTGTLPLAVPSLGDAEEAAVLQVLRSGWLSTGAVARRFEDMLAAYTGARAVVAVNSCTAALHVSLAALGIGPGDEVVTTPVTWAATANVIEHVGATPVFADVDPGTFNLDPADVARRLTARTRAVVPVHLAGQPVDVGAFERLAAERGLTVVEDAAHALGAEVGGRRVGALSPYTCFSFYATKNITTGEGGAVAVRNAADAAWLRVLTRHGMTSGAWDQRTGEFPAPECVAPGFKYNMPDIAAALGVTQLPRLPAFLARRAELRDRYRQALRGVPGLQWQQAVPGTRSAHHLLPVRVRSEDCGVTRDELLAVLHSQGIGAGVHYRALHLHPYYRQRYGLRAEDLPHATQVSEQILSLPLFPAMRDDDVDRVADVVRSVLNAR